MKKTYRRKRTFSEGLKRRLVEEIDNCEISVSEVCRIYKVSTTSVYRWIRKYSLIYQRQSKLIVEEKSESKKRAALEKKVSELQQKLGQKQMRLEYLEKILEAHKEDTGEDIEKKSE